MIHYLKMPNRPELFDHRDDPVERRNVVGMHPEVVTELRAEITEFLDKPKTQWDEATSVTIDQMQLNQLRALGYDFGGDHKPAGIKPLAEQLKDQKKARAGGPPGRVKDVAVEPDTGVEEVELPEAQQE